MERRRRGGNSEKMIFFKVGYLGKCSFSAAYL
jgi:hypothetical protein